MIIIYSLIFFLGASLGSFFYTYFLRREKDLSIVTPASHCDFCGNLLSVKYLVPVLSYIILRGKCPYCEKKIPIQTWLFEICYGMVSLICFYQWNWSIKFWIHLFQIALLILVAYTDFKTMMIYRVDIVCIGVLEIIYRLWQRNDLFSVLKYGLLLGAVFYLLMRFTKAMGQGDVEFAFVCGLFADSFYDVFSIFKNSFVWAAMFSLILLLFKKKGRKDEIAFGPFMALAVISQIFWRL